jgi:hypothetical protein
MEKEGMMNDSYFYPVSEGLWTTSRTIAGVRIALVQNRPLASEDHIALLCNALSLPHTQETIDRYFPIRGERRCPTLELFELLARHTHPHHVQGPEVGV